MTGLEASNLIEMIPKSLLEQLGKDLGVDKNVSRLRGEVMLSLLLFGACRSDRLSTRVLEHIYNSPFFDCFSTKDKKHKTRHSSIADRLTKIPSQYFASIFNWAWKHFTEELSKSSKSKLISPIHRFDSTMIKISSGLVDWGMQVGRQPEEGYKQVQLKVTVGLKGLFPTSVKTYFKQKDLSEEKALYKAIIEASPDKKDWVVFDRGLKSRKSFKALDLQDIQFVTRGAENCRYKKIREYKNSTELSVLDTNETKFIQDSIVYLYSDGHRILEHEFRLIEIQVIETGKSILFITNIMDADIDASQIAEIYRQRWDIEVFFRFLKQELNIKHLINRSKNGVEIQIYVALLLAILLTVYKISNNISGYKIAKLLFHDSLFIHIASMTRINSDGT